MIEPVMERKVLMTAICAYISVKVAQLKLGHIIIRKREPANEKRSEL